MRLLLLCAFLVIIQAPLLLAEDAAELREKGIAALKDSQANPRATVDAARAFAKAAALYSGAGDEEKSVEMNSFLYWCKKKMTLQDIDAFTKGGEAAVAEKLEAVAKLAPAVDEAQKWFDRAEKFAAANPNEHLLIAVRFYEVADRFQGSKPSLAAQDRSLKEQLLDKSSAAKIAVNPNTVRPADPAVAGVEKRAVPKTDDLKQAEKVIKDLLKADYAKTDAPGRQALIAKLFQQAGENKADPAAEYVLLHEARDLAVLAGDTARATEAQTRLRDAFKTDFAATLLDLRKLEPSAKSAETATALAALLSLGADDAVAAADYDQAVRFNSRAEDLLPLIKDTALKTRVKSEIPRVQALKRESVAALAAQKTLAAKPDDADANLAAGKFALLLFEVEKSMPLLAKGSDAALSALARRELTPPQDAGERVQLADDWFDRAEKEPSTYLKTQMQERAALWYASALPGLTGLAKLKVEGRIKTLAPNVKVESTPIVSTQTPKAAAAEPKKVPLAAGMNNGLLLTIGDETSLWKNTAVENLPSSPTPITFSGYLILPEVFKALRLRSGTAYGSERIKFIVAGEVLSYEREGQTRIATLPEKQYPKRVEFEIGKNIAGTPNWKWGPLEWSIDGGRWVKVPVENLESGAAKKSIAGKYRARQDEWGRDDIITLNEDSTFARSGGEGGTWELKGDELTLKWKKWAAQTLKMDEKRNFTGKVRMTPLPPNAYIADGKIVVPLDNSESAVKAPSKTQPSPGPFKELTLDLGNGIVLVLVEVKPGKFVMGSPPDEAGRSASEELHTVTISKSFYMSKYPVTQEQFERVMETNPSKFKGPKNPVESLTWKQALEFCKLLRQKVNAELPPGMELQLPTEAQWEYACRAGTQTKFYSGNEDSELDGVAWNASNSHGKTHPVGEKRPNAFGLYDMLGNVRQYCLDAYSDQYQNLPATDPFSSQGGARRVAKGGSWNDRPPACRAAQRESAGTGAGSHSPSTGFRVALAEPVQSK